MAYSNRRILSLALIVVFVFFSPCNAKKLSVAVQKANIRKGPGTKYPILWSAGKYYPADIIKKAGNWYRIKDFEGDIGWMHKSLLRQIPAVIVKVGLANARKGPGKKYGVLFQAEKGASFKVLRKKKGWLRVQHADGEIGWIYNKLVWGD
jgi:SH3-like domain-containing protein